MDAYQARRGAGLQVLEPRPGLGGRANICSLPGLEQERGDESVLPGPQGVEESRISLWAQYGEERMLLKG